MLPSINPATEELQIILTAAPAENAYCVTLRLGEDGAALPAEAMPPVNLERLEPYLKLLPDYIVSPVPSEHMQALGRELAALALPPGIRHRLAGELNRRTNPTAGIHLVVQAPEWPDIQNLPWEFLHLDDSQFPSARRGFWGLCHHFHLIRRMGEPQAVLPVPMDSLRLLIAWADPRSARYPALPHIQSEIRGVLAALDTPPCRHIQTDILHSATPNGLKHRLTAFEPHILHFIGHGDKRLSGAYLVLEGGEAGVENMLNVNELSEWLSGTSLRLVVLSACGTLSSAHPIASALIRQGVAAVVGMQLPLRAGTVSQLMGAFYSALAQPSPVEQALWGARQVVQAAGPDWGVPTLYLAGTGELFTRLPLPPAPPPLPAPFTVPYPRNEGFCGREETLTQLRQSLIAAPQRPHALVGMGGLGKTQLAVEYAYRHRRDYPGGVFWINARETHSLNEDYAAIGHWFSDIPDTLAVQEGGICVRDRLNLLTQPALLIYDNVMRAQDLHLRPQNEHCHILLTTREESINAQIGDRQAGGVILVPNLDEEAALRLLQTSYEAKNERDTQAARKIAKVFGYLPLALALAAHHIALIKDIDFSMYLNWLQNDPLAALQEARKKFVAATGHDGSVYDAITLSYNSLDSPARSLLATAACFSERGISQDLLAAAAGQSKSIAFAEMVAALTGCSLVRRGNSEEDEAQPRLVLHELVRIFAHQQMGTEEGGDIVARVAQTLADCLRRANQVRSWRSVRREIAHGYSALALCRDFGVRQSHLTLLQEMAVYLRENLDFPAAVAHFAEAKQVTEQLFGTQSPETVQAILELGEALEAAREYEEALTVLNEGMTVARTILPPDDAVFADYYNSIGYALKYKQERKRALKYYQKALKLSRRCYGPSHEKVAMCLNNIGVLYEAEEDFDMALRFFHQALPIYMAAYGPRDIMVARCCLNNMGRVLTQAGQSEEALKLHQEALTIFQAVHGDEHLDVADTHFFLGDAHRAMGQRDEAIRHYETALPLYERFYGVEHKTYQKLIARLKSLNVEIPGNVENEA